LTLGEILIAGATELGVELLPEQADACLFYLSELKKWNKKINLTAVTRDRDIIVKHCIDSFAFLKGLDHKPGLKLLDMGSGAGFPALPIKIVWPDVNVTMVESVKKKGAFLRHIIRSLHLIDTEVVDDRVESLSGSFCNAFDVVTARAFADMGSALSAGSPLLKPGGVLVLSRGPEETVSDQDVAHAGVVVHRKIPITLPHSDYRRVIWVFRKSAA
jgi:16S rRNA (guanine527-N7)-methyltransferase